MAEVTRIVSHLDQALARFDKQSQRFVTLAGIAYTNEVKRRSEERRVG